ncbi:uncharacterized protein [Ptychodera flava]|uniref:uncharacterized protein isoform X1 n=1 Tax=Ptychodera flava TaxID=63121 RepID=UPI003969C248
MPRSQLKPWKTENGDLPYTGENGYNQFDHLKHTRSNQYGDMIGSGNIDETDERMIFEGSQPLQIPFPSVNGPTSSVPYTLNLDMSMNNDLLDLSKPLKGYPLRKGVSNISLDSLNDNYIDSNDTLRHSSRETSSAEGSLENLLELSREIQEYHENEEFSNFERWNNYVNLAKSQCSSSGHSDDFQAVQDENTNLVHFKDEASGAKSPKGDFSPGQQMPLNPNFHLPLKSKSISAQIHNQLYGPLIHSAPAGENASSNSTMSIATTGSLRSDVTASPESYDMLYRSFEIAAMLDREDRQQGKTLQPSVPNIEMLSPKLQRLRQQSVARQSSPLPNFCSSGDKVFKQIEREEKPDNESRKVTFADLAQQRKRNELEKEEVRPVSLPVVTEIGQHWTELLSSTRTPDFVKQVRQQSEGLSPRRPQSLPIGLRHVKKPASRPFPKDVTPESFNSFRQEEPTDCITPELGVSRTFSAPEGLERNEEILIEEKCYDSADNLVFSTSSQASRALTEACIANNNGFHGNGFIAQRTMKKIPPLSFTTSTTKPKVLESFAVFPSNRDAGFHDMHMNMQHFYPSDDDGHDYDYDDDDYSDYDDENYYNCNGDSFQVDGNGEVHDAVFMQPVKLGLVRFDSLEVEPCELVAVATQTDVVTVEEGTQTAKKSVRIAIPNHSDANRTSDGKYKLKTEKFGADLSRPGRRERRIRHRSDGDQKTGIVKSPHMQSLSSQVDNDNSGTVHLTADGNRPVKVRQSQRHKVLEQDLLGEVVYVRNKPLKPIRQVDAEYNIRKGLPLPVPLQIPISQPILPAPEPLPPSFDFMDQPSFFGSEDAPEDIPLSAYEDMENSIEVDILQKKGLVGSINSAVDLILEHFGKSRQICSKMRLGDSYYTPDIGHIVLRYLCPALAAMLTDGMQPFIRNVIVGRVKNTVWHVVQAVTQLGPATKQMHEILSHVSNQGYLADPAMKFNAFVFGLLNAKCLEVWLQHVVSRTDILEKLYKPDSFLRLADGLLKPLLQELSVAIQPLCELPLKLDYKFEYNHIQDMKAREEGKNRLREEHEKKLPFSPFQLMKKVTRKTYERVSNHTHGRCSSEKKFFEEGGGDDSGKGWSVNWMKGLVSSGSNQTEKHVEKYPPIKSTLKTAETKFQDKHCPGTKSDLPSDKGKTARWSLFGSSISKALDNMIVEGGSSLIYGRLSHRDSFRLRRRGVTSETAIPAHFADELMGPRPDPAGASDSNASSPEWNLSCTQLMQSEAIKRQTKSS